MYPNFGKRKALSDGLVGVCRVSSCKSYGQTMTNIVRHVREQHRNMTFRQHQWLPTPTATSIAEKTSEKKYMQYRKLERCYVTGCRSYGRPYHSFFHHLKSQHNLSRTEYNLKYPQINLTYYTPNYADDLSVILPEEREYIEKPDIGYYSEFPDMPAGKCPVKKLDAREGFWPLKNEEKFWFIRRWLKSDKFSDATEEDEYPKDVMLHFEADPEVIFNKCKAIPIYVEGDKQPNLRQRFTIHKRFGSKEEEFYFTKFLVHADINTKRFHAGFYEFVCIYCNEWHRSRLLYSHTFEHDVFITSIDVPESDM